MILHGTRPWHPKCHGLVRLLKKGSGTVAGTARRVLRTTVPDPFFSSLLVPWIISWTLQDALADLNGPSPASKPYFFSVCLIGTTMTLTVVSIS